MLSTIQSPKMQVVAISPSRRSNQVWLKFDDSSFIPFKIDDVVNLKLKKFTDLSPDLYQVILESSANFAIYEYSLRQIAISPKVEYLLRQKINQYCQKLKQKYNFSTTILSTQSEKVLALILAAGYLDEQNYVEYLSRKFPKKSQTELNYKLSILGISIKLPVSPDQEIQKVRDLLTKKYSRLDFTDFKIKNNLIAKLYRQGFAINHIKNAIDEFAKIG